MTASRGIRKDHHSYPELEQLREDFTLWYFDPNKTIAQQEWADQHGVHIKTLANWKKRPEFMAKMEEFRKTYREVGDEALQNLFRFALSPEPRVAIPAIRIVVDVMGYTSPIQVEHSARGLGLMEYLAHVGQKAIAEYNQNSGSEPGIPPLTVIEGSYSEAPLDPWETVDTDRMN